MIRDTLRAALPGLLAAALLSSCAVAQRRADIDDPDPEAQAEVGRALRRLLDAAAAKDFATLESMHLYGPKFSKWDTHTSTRLDADATRSGERAGIEPLDLFRASAEDLKVDVLGETAVATFVMDYEVAARGQSVRAKVKATLVWVRTDDGWRIAHEHFSSLPPDP